MFNFFQRDESVLYSELPQALPEDETAEQRLLAERFVLCMKIIRLRWAGKRVIAERERWKALARATDSGKFDRLRRLLARELHPDHCPESEKAVRAEIFKRLWPEVERIARGSC